MKQAWDALPWTNFAKNHEVRKFIQGIAAQVKERVAQSGRIDVLQDLAFYIPYRIIEEYIGIPGPDYLSELVVALPFSKRFLTKIPADWLRGRQDQLIKDPGYATMQIWARLSFGEVIGNFQDKREFTRPAIQATAELLTYIDEKILEERLKEVAPNSRPRTLLEQLVRQAPDPKDEPYFAEVRAILADMMVTVFINIGMPFSKAIQQALKFGFDCKMLVDLLEDRPQIEGYKNVELLAYELLRFFPSAPAIFRRCETNTTLPSGVEIRAGDWVASLLGVAGQDRSAFRDPEKFSLGVHLFPNPPLDPRPTTMCPPIRRRTRPNPLHADGGLLHAVDLPRG